MAWGSRISRFPNLPTNKSAATPCGKLVEAMTCSRHRTVTVAGKISRRPPAALTLVDCAHLVRKTRSSPEIRPQPWNLYNLWDLHIPIKAPSASRRALCVATPAADTTAGPDKNESAPDPGLGLGTPVEQPSPRTAQLQPRFVSGSRKWPRRASQPAPLGYRISSDN